MKEPKLKLKPFDWLTINYASINIGWTELVGEEDGYSATLNLFVTGGKVEEFPIIIETEIYSEDFAEVVREALVVLSSLTSNIIEEITVFNDEGDEEYQTSISEILGYDGCGCDECAAKSEENNEETN